MDSSQQKQHGSDGEVPCVSMLDDNDDEEMMSPHEIVARCFSVSPKPPSQYWKKLGEPLKGRISISRIMHHINNFP